MFVYNFKNVDFEDNSIFVDSEPAHQRHKLFLFTKLTEHSPLMIGNGYNTFPFCAEDFLVLLYNIYPVLRFFHFLSFLIKFFCFNCVVFHERIYQLLFHFLFVDSLCLLNGFKTFLPLETENNQYTINLKHPLQTKTRLCWAKNTFFLTWLRVVKVFYNKHFCKTVFQINPISKKNLTNILLKYTQINIMA